MKIKLTDLVISEAMQIRICLDEPTVSDYEELITEGASFPPIDVWRNDGALILLAGFHRVEASKRAGCIDIDATVHNFPDAQRALVFACRANSTHGLRMSAADKRNAIAKLIASNPEQSNLAIARFCGVSDHTVKAQRDTMGASAKPDKVTGRDGKKRAASVKREPKEREESGDGETDAPPPDTGLGGDILSPETIAKNEPHSITKDEALKFVDDAIERFIKDEYKTRAANMMAVKNYISVRGR